MVVMTLPIKKNSNFFRLVVPAFIAVYINGIWSAFSRNRSVGPGFVANKMKLATLNQTDRLLFLIFCGMKKHPVLIAVIR